MTSFAVHVPVLNRPHRAAPLARGFAGVDHGAPCTLRFLCTRGDLEEVQACQAAAAAHARVDVWVYPGDWAPGDWARKHNWAFRQAGEEWVLLGADDLTFHPGWAAAVVAAHRQTGACVVGTNDAANPRVKAGHHSTHPAVNRGYLECGTIDEDDKIIHEGYGHQFCNPPEAPVWMADLSFRPLGDVRPGDEVVGWERQAALGAHRRLTRSRVLSVGIREAPLVRVEMDSGRSFRCTPDHNWLNAAWAPSSRHPRQWVTPRAGRSLLHVADAPEADYGPELSRLAGWLGGIYDGEGSGAPNPQIGQSAAANPEVYARICEVLELFRIPHTPASDRVWLTGGRRALLRFIAIAQPTKRARLVDYVLGGARFGIRDRVSEVIPDGGGQVVSMKTTTGNYVAWGYASRNCDDELVQTARVRRTFAFARDAVVEHRHPDWGTADPDETYALGQSMFLADLALFRARQHLWLGRVSA